MASYDNNLRIKEIATGAEAGSWGSSTNTNLSLIGDALGYATEATFNSDANKSVTVGDATVSPYRSIYVKVTSSATLSTARDLTIGPNTIKRVMFVENATTGGQSIVIKQGSGGSVTVPNGAVVCVYLDGAGAGAAVVSVFTDFVVQDSFKIAGTTPTLTLGDSDAEDTKIIFSGNSETFHIGLDDSADDLLIGKGATLGTEPRLQFDGQGAVRIISDAPANGQLTLADIGANADQAFFKQDGGTLSILAQQSTTQTGTVVIGGQNNSISATYAQFNGSGVTLNGASVIIGTGSLFLTNSSSQGIHLQSPNGTEYKITVDNSGNLVTTAQ